MTREKMGPALTSTSAGEPSTDVPGSPSKTTGRAWLIDDLRLAIMNGDYVPNQRLVETDLAEQYGANRGTVRAALKELAADGLVDILHNKGARVRSVSLEEAIEITEVRTVLETLSAGKAAERVTPHQAEMLREIGGQMRDAVERSDLVRYSELNAALHAAVREIAAHRTSEVIITRLGAQIVRYQFRLARRPGRAEISLRQHELIIAAIIARDPEGATTAMQQHLRSVVRALQDGDAAP